MWRWWERRREGVPQSCRAARHPHGTRTAPARHPHGTRTTIVRRTPRCRERTPAVHACGGRGETERATDAALDAERVHWDARWTRRDRESDERSAHVQTGTHHYVAPIVRDDRHRQIDVRRKERCRACCHATPDRERLASDYFSCCRPGWFQFKLLFFFFYDATLLSTESL
jgi:hypothetical protein